MTRSVIAILSKEIRDCLRDRRSIMGVLAFIVLLPIVMATGMGSVTAIQSEAPPFKVENAQEAPELLAYLEQEGFRWEQAADDAEQAVRANEAPFALAFDSDFSERFADQEPAHVKILLDGTRNGRGVQEIQEAIREFNDEMASTRLRTRGVSPELITPVNVDTSDLSTSAERTGRLLGGVLIYLLLAPFMAGMSVAIDMLAGERERRSLELLMVQPVTPFIVTIGKWLATLAFALTGAVLATLVIALLLSVADLSGMGMEFAVHPLTLLLMLICAAPIALLSSALQCLVSLFAKSYKEAQMYMSVLMALPVGVVIGVDILDFLGKGDGVWRTVVPLVGQYEPLKVLLQGGTPEYGMVFVAALSTLVLAIVTVWTASRLLARERLALA